MVVAGGAQQQADSVDSTTTAVDQLSKAIDQISQGSQEQSGQVEQATGIVLQVSKAVAEVAQNAQAAANGSQEANESAIVTSMDVEMKTKLLTIVSTGITIGFLLAMGVAAISRTSIAGNSPELEVAFTAMVAMMGGWLIYYVVRTSR